MQISGAALRQERQKIGLSQAKLAELSEIPQHLLSSFELGKRELSDGMLKAINLTLSDRLAVTQLITRAKRYEVHRYRAVTRPPDRVARAAITSGNSAYRQAVMQMFARHLEPKDGRLSALSLFSGCGGFSLGFSAAGFAVRGFVEIDPGIAGIYRANFPRCAQLGSDIAAVTDGDLRQLSASLGAIDVVIGGPPCQGFSLSGKRESNDPRNSLFQHYLRFVEALQPKIAVLENVRLLTSMRNPSGKMFRSEISESFQRRGYDIRAFEINAKEYGVPQHRERVLFVAVRRGLGVCPSLPAPTHAETSDMFSTVEPYRTFGDACSDLPYIESGESSADPLHVAVSHPAHVLEWLWDVPEGSSAHENADPRLRPRSGYNTTYKRQVWSQPASTVQTTFGMISGCRNVHPIATRSLTIREAARIQSFPDAYRFTGTLQSIRTGIGNAVPPLLAYRLALHLQAAIHSL